VRTRNRKGVAINEKVWGEENGSKVGSQGDRMGSQKAHVDRRNIDRITTDKPIPPKDQYEERAVKWYPLCMSSITARFLARLEALVNEKILPSRLNPGKIERVKPIYSKASMMSSTFVCPALRSPSVFNT